MLNNILTWPSLDMTQASLVCLGVALLLGIFIAFGYDRLVLKKKKTVYTIIGYGPSAAH